MKSAQRVLALLLAVVLTFGLLPAQALNVYGTQTVDGDAVDGESGDIDVPFPDEEETGPGEGTDTPTEDTALSVTPAASVVYPGDELTLTVSVSGSNAWTSLGYIPLTDSAAFAVTGGNVLSAGQRADLWDFTAADGGTLYFSDASVVEGNLFRFTVRIRDDAPAGDYPVTNAAAITCGSTKVPVILNDATITVGVKLPQGVIARGDCGDDLTWTLNKNGTLTISGTGAMYDYAADAAPWHDYEDSVRSVALEAGVTGIGAWSFYGLSNLISVTMAESVTGIGEAAFGTTLTTVYYTGTVAQWKAIVMGDNNDWLRTATIHTADDKYCAHCGETVPWSEWAGATAPASGHYYLSGDLTNEQTEALVIPEDTDVVLDLCGHTYTAAKGTLFRINGTLSVVDSAEGGTLTATDDFVPEADSSMLYIAGERAALNLYDGMVTGGAATYGGNVFVTNGGMFNMYGGTVTGGTAEIGGGNICLMGGAALDISGGTVSDGTADLGGNVAVYSGSSFAVTGGTVTGGTANDGGNIYATGSDESIALFGMNGGSVAGDIAMRSHSLVYFEGTPVVTKGTVTGLSLSEGVLIIMAQLTDGASVVVSANGVFTETNDNAADYAAYFTPADNAYRIAVKDNALSCERRYLDTDFAIVTQPAPVEITAGFTAQFAVETLNAASYKWQYRRNEDAPWVNTTMSGYATDTLSVPALLARNGYQYRCRVTGTNGKILYTEPATLTVNDSIIIKAQPTRQIVSVDTNAVFTVEAEGTGLTYQWQYRRHAAEGWMVTKLDGCNTATLTVNALLGRNGYQYRCAITDENGIKVYSSHASLSALGFTAHPADRTVAVNTNAVFTVAAKGQGLTYQWQYRKSESGTWMTTSLSGAQTDTLTVPALASRDGYQYRCAITDALGIIRYSDPATLTVIQ